MMKLLTGIAVAVMSINVLFADLLVYEGFDYAPTDDAGIGTALTNGYGWAESSHWSRENSKDQLYIYDGSLGYSDVVTSGNKYGLGGSNGRYSSRSFSSSIDSSVSDIIWGGVIMKTPSTKDGRTSRFVLSPEQLYIYADSATTVKVGGGSATQIDTGISSGTATRLYLYKIDLTGVEPVARIWISPSDISSEASLGAPSVTITNIGAVYSGCSLGNSGGNPASYDEIRIGTEFGDALFSLPPVIPVGTVLIVN